MKFLPEPTLNKLSSLLSSSPNADTRVNIRFEAYSVKPVREDRRMYKEMEEMYMSGQEEMDVMSFSPEMKEAGLSSCFGRLDEKESRKVHYLLVSTLNTAFPDYDFGALKPDHFTREPNAAVVLEQISGNLLYRSSIPIMSPTALSPLLQPVGHSLSSSPSNAPHGSAGDLYRHLCDVVPLDECEVYSWFPSYEYDPHVDPEEGEGSDDGYDYDYDFDDDVPGGMELDDPTEASWGQAGMELDMDGPPPPTGTLGSGSHGGGRRDSKSRPFGRVSDPAGTLPMFKRPSEDEGVRGSGGLLWSANYFFYSKRSKRVLFATCWSRKRRPHSTSIPTESTSTFPEPISTSLSSGHASSSPLASRKPRVKTRHKPHARPTKRVIKATPSKGDMSGLIPIRGMSSAPPRTPQSQRFASSAPSAYGMHIPQPTPPGAMARMTAGPFKPRIPSLAPPSPRMGPREVHVNQGQAGQGAMDTSRVRKDRSESTTPGPQSLLSAMAPGGALSGSGSGHGMGTGSGAGQGQMNVKRSKAQA